MQLDRRTVLVGLGAACAGCSSPTESGGGDETTGEDTLYHVSTADALSCGHFADETTVADLLDNGDWGLGTVNGVNGELVVVDGDAYAVRGDGTADSLGADVKTPFAAVTRFRADETVELSDIGSFEEFGDRLREELPRTDHFHALRVEGELEYLRTRSVEKQVEPYPTLETVVENERVFEFENVRGDMPVFFVPDQFEHIHPPGYHAHFLTADRDGGGHVYDLRAGSLTVQIDRIPSVELELADREVDEYPPC